MKKYFFSLIFYILAFPLFAQVLSERIANYDIQVKLDTEENKLWGSQQLHWRNTSQDAISEVQFHLYMNAFKDDQSTFMKESGGKLRNDRLDKKEMNYGNIYLTSLKSNRGENLYNSIRFIQPDDDNKNDQTVIEVQSSSRGIVDRFHESIPTP